MSAATDATGTPLPVRIEMEAAELSARLVARLIDLLVYFAILLAISLALLPFEEFLNSLSAREPIHLISVYAGWITVCSVLQGVLLHRSGQTVGKRLMNIRILRKNGDRAGVARRLLLRGWTPCVVSQITMGLSALLDALWVFGTEKRCLHDYLADTVVVRAEGNRVPTWTRPPG